MVQMNLEGKALKVADIIPTIFDVSFNFVPSFVEWLVSFDCLAMNKHFKDLKIKRLSPIRKIRAVKADDYFKAWTDVAFKIKEEKEVKPLTYRSMVKAMNALSPEVIAKLQRDMEERTEAMKLRLMH